MFELVKTVVLIVGMAISIGGVVFGTVMFVRKNKEEAQAASKKYADALLLEMESRHKVERDTTMSQFNALLDLSKTDMRLAFVRLNDVDVWRKEINGQLKLLGQQSEFTNKILEGQGRHLEMISTSAQQLSVSVAEIKASLDRER